jgi:hypothetical protein
MDPRGPATTAIAMIDAMIGILAIRKSPFLI